MTDAYRCPFCGAPFDAGHQFCGSCGRSLASEGAPAAVAYVAAPHAAYPPMNATPAPAVQGAVLSPGGPPSMFGAPPASFGVARTPVTSRSIGAVALIVLILATSIAGLFIMLDYAYWMNWQLSDDNIVGAGVDAAFGFGYMITSVYGFTLVRRLWQLQPGAWRTANMLAAGWLGLVLLALGVFGTETLSLVGLVVNSALLVGLNLTPIRKEFGQGPLL